MFPKSWILKEQMSNEAEQNLQIEDLLNFGHQYWLQKIRIREGMLGLLDLGYSYYFMGFRAAVFLLAVGL